MSILSTSLISSLKHLLFTLQGDAHNLMKAVKNDNKKKTTANMYFSLPAWLSSMLVFAFLQRGQKSL